MLSDSHSSASAVSSQLSSPENSTQASEIKKSLLHLDWKECSVMDERMQLYLAG